jgi:ABC-type amino acid transport substrate-binding protein
MLPSLVTVFRRVIAATLLNLVGVLLVVECSVAVALSADQVDDAADLSNKRLLVGTMTAPPFAIRTDDGRWTGISIELWEKIAHFQEYQYQYQAFDYDRPGLLRAVEEGEVDLAIATLPITETDESRIDFSHPYYSTGLGIAVLRQSQLRRWALLQPVLSPRFLTAVGMLLGIILVVGLAISFVERRSNPEHFGAGLFRGIGQGIWWSAVTMTTVGYGDTVPKSSLGRLFALTWMFSSIFLISCFTAVMASSFTAEKLQQEISSPDDLTWVRIGTVSDSRGDQFLSEHGYRLRRYPFVIQACKALQRGEVEAVVFDKAILHHMVQEYGWNDVAILPQSVLVQDYAVALPEDSPLREPINRALLRAIHDPLWGGTVRRFVGTQDELGE